ncbi:alpha-mannosidase 2x-like isoform X2 [Corticium candelabrum]|uniref:alpha-mannosidase 2x-like isoform X2 n=1 Tax=Corticium candelabrum TaxID=121492 RepID=UPI002E259175|nr:alpha-mannosidase 2x-like isoform X2 [Corticium candelabrum]
MRRNIPGCANMRRWKIIMVVGVITIVVVSMNLLFRITPNEEQSVLDGESQKRISQLQHDVELLENQLNTDRRQYNQLKRMTVDVQPNTRTDKDIMLKHDPNKVKASELKLKSTSANDKKSLSNHSKVELNIPVLSYPSVDCQFSGEPSGLKSDVQMLDVFDMIPFGTVDGGVWKQGFEITYNLERWKDKPLNVFIVPHSHNDPGWLKTFQQYYVAQTRQILNNVVDGLNEDASRRFIWAEISYFDLWWNEQSAEKRGIAKKLIENGQLEIVTGGWVMNDEANTHYYAMIDQMIEGHQWLKQNLGITPHSGWAIDPFGHSSTMAYLLARMGFDFMLIQRVHYSVKKYLAQRKNLEFRWRQNWDHSSTTDMFCHMMPFYSYDIPHTCGPDPKICCQFDFRRLPGGGMVCPWKVPPVAITDANVAARAEMLLDQYRKKAELFQTRNLLVPLGDDFRYDKELEIARQFSHYNKIISYINSHPEMRARVQFATLSEYTKAVVEDVGTLSSFPILSGDFYTYADRSDHYWSGYYTTRPFFKLMDRRLESALRSAEILFSLATVAARVEGPSSFPVAELFGLITSSRRDLALFQHHDGITGTAKNFVVQDYGNRMLSAINSAQIVMIKSAQFLLSSDRKAILPQEMYFEVDDFIQSYDSTPVKKTIALSEHPKKIFLYNSLEHNRVQAVCIIVSTSKVKFACLL